MFLCCFKEIIKEKKNIKKTFLMQEPGDGVLVGGSTDLSDLLLSEPSS
jgi:hypothetical protein